MLSRTADHLFWMARYMERAENTARMLDVNYQMSLLPQSEEAAERGWRGLLSINEISGDFAKRNAKVTPSSVIDYMVNDERNGGNHIAITLSTGVVVTIASGEWKIVLTNLTTGMTKEWHGWLEVTSPPQITFTGPYCNPGATVNAWSGPTISASPCSRVRAPPGCCSVTRCPTRSLRPCRSSASTPSRSTSSAPQARRPTSRDEPACRIRAAEG